MLNTISAKLIFFSIISILSIALSVSFSYLIAISSIKTIMETDVSSVADALQKNINYIASIRPDAYRSDDFKKMLYSIKIGKSGYPFMMDDQGTLVVHYKDEGRSLAGQKHIDHIRTHKEGGIFEYKSVSTGQEKIVAYRYIDKWGVWVVPGVNKADYFQQLKQLFIKWNVVFAVVLIIAMSLTSVWINRTVTNPLKGMLRIFKDTGGEAGSSAETRELVSRLLGNLLYSGRR